MSLRCWTDGGNFEKFSMEIESGARGGITLGIPEVRSILFSLPERMICAEAGEPSARSMRPMGANRLRLICMDDITRAR